MINDLHNLETVNVKNNACYIIITGPWRGPWLAKYNYSLLSKGDTCQGSTN